MADYLVSAFASSLSYRLYQLDSRLSVTLRERISDIRGRGIYSHFANEHQCIFIHIPKAAGTSIANALFNNGSRHVPWSEYYRANPRKFRKYFKFAFVRNPWDRLVSSFYFLKSGGLNEMDRRFAEKHLAQYENFEDFVVNGLALDEIRGWVHFRAQSDWICDDDGRVMVDFVGRFENLREDFVHVARKLGKDSSLPMHNTSNHRIYTECFTQASREVTARVYGKDIEIFGYQFQ